MTFPILVAGLVLWLTNGWFSGQHVVGEILTIVGGVGLLLQFLIVAFVLWAAGSKY